MPIWPTPEIVLSTLVRTALELEPTISFPELSDMTIWPLPSSVTPSPVMTSSVRSPVELSSMTPVLSTMPESGSTAPSDRHRAAVLDCRGLIEYEVARGQRAGIHAVQRDRLAGADRDHRIAIAIAGD